MTETEKTSLIKEIKSNRKVVEHVKIKVVEMKKRKPILFAKYASSIADIQIPKLSEEEIKEKEQEFERIKNILTNSDIARLPSILFNQTESNNGTDKARQETHTGEGA